MAKPKTQTLHAVIAYKLTAPNSLKDSVATVTARVLVPVEKSVMSSRDLAVEAIEAEFEKTVGSEAIYSITFVAGRCECSYSSRRDHGHGGYFNFEGLVIRHSRISE